ncbi:unnamed protein product [Rotaria sp. Silwood1]|nr:unnamed protein product [Rotaria sp. Silwood1]CAF4975147.1 unnamed protein product [Rotaria sp. Silwood1]
MYACNITVTTILNYFHRTVNNIQVLPRKNDERMTKEDDPEQINNNSENQTLKSKIISSSTSSVASSSSAAAASSSRVASPITSLPEIISVSEEKISKYFQNFRILRPYRPIGRVSNRNNTTLCSTASDLQQQQQQ